MSRYVRFSGRFQMTATGDIDLYPLFAEHCYNCTREAWGLVLPTGIAVNDSNKTFFSKLIDENRLISLYDFENKEGLFDIHRMFKFCLLTVGQKQDNAREVSGGFYLTRLDHLLDPTRIYKLKTTDFELLNPNTKTCPVFRTSRDAMLTTKIYRRCKVMINDTTSENSWNIKFGSMIHMSNDSHLFRTYSQLINEGANLKGNRFLLSNQIYVPLYEGKMIWHYNHHYADWPIEGERQNTVPTPTLEQLANPYDTPMPWYWIPQEEVENRLVKVDAKDNIIWEWTHKWLIGFRDITNSTNERTFIVSPIPDAFGVGNSATLLFVERGTIPGAVLMGMMSSLVFDYTTRQKIGGSHASISFVKQFPVLTPEQVSASSYEQDIVERVARLCWFNHDLDGWMEELREECPAEYDLPEEPVIWDEGQRAVWQAELDAIFAHLYGLTTEELRYILDPEDVCGKGCINETFRVLKERELRELGEYRTKRLVMEAWNKFGFDNKLKMLCYEK